VEGLNKRFQFKERGGVRISDKEREKYQERLEYELSIIDRMGFNGYFLIVADFINFAKTHNIPVGPGRGSGAGSLVAFSLGITDLDPLPYNLLFERFLNPERISMPDFDVDFCQDRRAEVIEYVTQKYGKESVAQIVTFGKLQPKAAIKDVGRVLGMTFSEVDRISKLVPSTPKITLDEALEQEPRLKELVETDPQAASVINLSKKVEGLVRHSGVHAAGVVITSGQIVEIAPVSKGAAGEIVIQFDMIHAEKMGLVKFDFLGLKTLTHIQKALDQVELEKKIKIRPEEISIEDPNIYKVFCKGDTLGIFQFEGEGITEATIKIQPESFFDITAINALYRPGPMEMIPSYTARRWGKEPIEYLFKELEEILSETKGVIVYQEQVMAIASKIAGYSLGEADVLRRAIGKKKLEEMQKLQASFLQRSVDRGFEKKKVEELWELLVKFANYGFNKSHAAAYCVLSAQTAWLKYYYPAEFFAGLMSTEIANTDSIVRYSKDAIKHGIELLPPHINSSEYLFTVKEGKIHFALGAIKGVGVAPAQSIVKARKSQPFSKFECLEDFFLSVDLKCFNKKTLEALIKAGVLDDLGVERGVLLENYSQYLDWAQRRRRESETGQGSLFDLVEDYKETLKLPEKHSWDRARYLRAEKEVLGFYLTDHPLRGVQKLAEQVSSCPLSHLAQYYLENFKESALEKAQVSQFSDLRAQWRKPKGVKVRFLGIFNSIEERMTSKGTLMAFAQFEDLFAQAEMLIFPDTYVEVANRIEIGAPVLVEALLQERENQYKLILEKVSTLSESLKTIDRLHFKLSQLNKSDVQLLSQLFEGYAKYWDSPDHVVGGEVLVELSIFLPEFEKWVKIEKGLKAKLSLEFIERLETSLPPHLKEGLEYQLGS
jgi:DNA polymerase-3 subunit alpha